MFWVVAIFGMSLGLVLRTLTDHPRNEFRIHNTGNAYILYQKHGFGILTNWEEVKTFTSIDGATDEMMRLIKEHKE